jgi:hypothetical protein
MKSTFLLACLLAFTTTFAQQPGFPILFIDDSPDIFGNAELLASALDSLGYDVVYYDAAGTSTTPDSATYSNFSMVIWHTSTNGAANQLWNGNDTDNAALESYLDHGGKLWLIGNDFLYDRYGTPPHAFSGTDFPLKYLGISSYDVQSHGDDGGLGLPVAQPLPQPITGLKDLYWQFGALWWADGVTPISAAKTVYQMGDSTYVFYKKPCGVLYQHNNATVLSYFFDLSLAIDFATIKDNAKSVVTFFQGVTGTTNPPAAQIQMEVMPNPFRSDLMFRWSGDASLVTGIRLLDASGRLVASVTGESVIGNAFSWHLPAPLPSGLYTWQIIATNGVFSGKVVSAGGK